MRVNRVKIAEAISCLRDPFTCTDLMTELNLEHNSENQMIVRRILEDFEERGWVSNSENHLYFRVLEDFRF